jgi:hypothetical protein
MVDSVLGAARIVAATAAVGLLLPVAVASRALASSPDEHGYWWRFQLVENGPAAPPGVEEGELYVAADAVGVAAVSAIRASVGGATATALRLREVSATGSPSLRACATSGWTAPTGAGAFADRPSDERCTTDVVQGVRSADGLWEFPVGPLVTDDGVLDVVIVPGLDDQSVAFAAPDDATIVVAAPATGGSSLLADDVTDGPATGDPPVAAAPFGSAPESSGATTVRPSPAFDALTDLPAAAVAAPIAGTPASTFDDDVAPLPAPATVAAPSLPGSRSPLALLAVALVVGTWVYRGRAALRGAPAHPLSAPIGDRALELAGAASRLDEKAAS